MVVAIRLQRTGCRHRPFYRIAVSHSKRHPTKKFIEHIGTFNPFRDNLGSKHLRLNLPRVKYWLAVGAQPSDTVASLLSKFHIVPRPPVRSVLSADAQSLRALSGLGPILSPASVPIPSDVYSPADRPSKDFPAIPDVDQHLYASLPDPPNSVRCVVSSLPPSLSKDSFVERLRNEFHVDPINVDFPVSEVTGHCLGRCSFSLLDVGGQVRSFRESLKSADFDGRKVSFRILKGNKLKEEIEIENVKLAMGIKREVSKRKGSKYRTIEGTLGIPLISHRTPMPLLCHLLVEGLPPTFSVNDFDTFLRLDCDIPSIVKVDSSPSGPTHSRVIVESRSHSECHSVVKRIERYRFEGRPLTVGIERIESKPPIRVSEVSKSRVRPKMNFEEWPIYKYLKSKSEVKTKGIEAFVPHPSQKRRFLPKGEMEVKVPFAVVPTESVVSQWGNIRRKAFKPPQNKFPQIKKSETLFNQTISEDVMKEIRTKIEEERERVKVEQQKQETEGKQAAN